MDYLPLFHNLKNALCLMVGGGSIAQRKAKLLLKAGAKIRVVAPEISDALRQQVGSNGEFILEKYKKEHLDDCVLVISATDISEVNEQVSKDCKAIRLPVNVVDSPELCSVIMPAIVDRSPLVVGITSGGSAPVLARLLRSRIETMLPSAYGKLAQIANEFRDQVKQKITSMDGRRRFWEEVFSGRVAERALAGDFEKAKDDLQQKLDGDSGDCRGEVYLVGAGPGDPDLLTFKALKYMQQAEVVLHDRLVSDAVLDLVRRDADFIYVGKKRSDHAVPQKSINQMLVDYAKEGKRVLRLKGGDPFIFGRGGEEIELLAENNIPFVVVPGITAASGCASYSGIPLTHRDHAQSVRFLTGHLKDGTCAQPWSELVASNQTLVFYMGLVSLPIICEKLIEHGLSKDTPAALIEKGTTPDHRSHISSLNALPQYIQDNEIHAPTLLIVGNVVSLHEKLNWFKP